MEAWMLAVSVVALFVTIVVATWKFHRAVQSDLKALRDDLVKEMDYRQERTEALLRAEAQVLVTQAIDPALDRKLDDISNQLSALREASIARRHGRPGRD